MNNFTGRLYRKTALRNGDRRAGIQGVLYCL